MTDANEEAAINAMAAQVVYGDDDLRRDMREFILRTVKDALGKNYDPRLAGSIATGAWEPMANQILVNRAREIEKIVARYLTNKLQGDQY